MNEYIVQVDCLLFFIIDLQWTFIGVSKLKEQNAHSPPPTLLLPQKLAARLLLPVWEKDSDGRPWS